MRAVCQARRIGGDGVLPTVSQVPAPTVPAEWLGPTGHPGSGAVADWPGALGDCRVVGSLRPRGSCHLGYSHVVVVSAGRR
jgi:hypothetical protein